MGKRVLIGTMLLVIGVGFLLEQFAIITFSEAFNIYWPSILILIGLIGLFNKKSSKFGNMVLIVLGSLIQIDRLDLVNINIYKLFGPIILILLGLNIIFSKESIVVNTKSNHKGKKFSENVSMKDTINEFALMGGIGTNNRSQQFRGGTATAIMGGIEIDLKGAKLDNNGAVVEVITIMGGVEIHVPDNWRVEVTGTPIFGGWSNNTRHNTDLNSPLLKIRCTSIFGGMEVNQG